MIYIDNNATTPVDPEVFEAMKPYLMEEFGNPSSKHYSLAKRAAAAVEEARYQVARLIKAEPEQIIFTSSGSESNNFIIKGAADYLKNYQERGGHIISSSVEHMSVINSLRYLAGEIYNNKPCNKRIDRGYDCQLLPVNSWGQVEVKSIEEALREDSILASFIWVNNETGNINRIEEIVNLLSSRGVFSHSDATQAVGKLDIDVKSLDIDALSFSAHKIYGPKGCGAAYVKDTDSMTALIHGGAGQEQALRSGTLAVHNIVGFGKAAEIAREKRQEDLKKLAKMEGSLRELLRDKYRDIEFISREGESLPGLISFIIPSLDSNKRIRELGDKLALSSGSACSAGGKSPVLEAIGREEAAGSFFRMGLNKYITDEDLLEIARII